MARRRDSRFLQGHFSSGSGPLQESVSHLHAHIHRLERQLAKAEWARGLAEAVTHCVPEILLVTSPQGLIRHALGGTAAILGYDSDELAGKPIGTLMDVTNDNDEGAGPTPAQLRMIVTQGFVQGIRRVFLRRDGVRIPTLMSGSVLRDRYANLTGIVCLAYDLRRLEGLERNLADANAELQHANRQLERSNRDFRDFARTAAHDLRAPLRAIAGFAGLLHKKLQQRLDDQARGWLRQITDASARMDALMEQLLAYAEVDGRRLVPGRQVDVRKLVEQVRSDLSEDIREVGAHVIVGELPEITADEIQIYQALLNLIGNALKYRRPGVTPIVKIHGETDVIPEGHHPANGRTVRASTKAGWCRIIVEDNGIGFDEEEKATIFAPFRRLVAGSHSEGSGLGLAIVAKIVARHGGRISATSSKGAGSRFALTLPAADSHAPPGVPAGGL